MQLKFRRWFRTFPVVRRGSFQKYSQGLKRCLEFVRFGRGDLACGAVKFQLFSDSGAVCGEALQSDPKVLQAVRLWELPVSILGET